MRAMTNSDIGSPGDKQSQQSVAELHHGGKPDPTTGCRVD
jgi:hypothetical protein